jgi:hypothetical protein
MAPTWVRSVVVGCVLLGSACDDPVSPEITALMSAEAQWHAAQPASNSYIIQQAVNCFCIDGGTVFEVTVTAGTITVVRRLPGLEVVPVDQYARFRTIDQLFDEIRAALKKDGVLLHVEYNSSMGYPTVVSLDPVRNAVDDEVAYQTSNFRTTP